MWLPLPISVGSSWTIGLVSHAFLLCFTEQALHYISVLISQPYHLTVSIVWACGDTCFAELFAFSGSILWPIVTSYNAWNPVSCKGGFRMSNYGYAFDVLQFCKLNKS